MVRISIGRIKATASSPNPIAAERDSAGNSWTAPFEPGRANIAPGSRIDVQARLDDGGPPQLWLEASHSFGSRSGRDSGGDNKAWAILLLGGVLVLGLYVAGFAALLCLAPLRLVGLGGAPGLPDRPKGDGWSGFALRLGAQAVDGLALPWFARRLRVRHAFVAGFRAGTTLLAQLGRHARPSVLPCWRGRRS